MKNRTLGQSFSTAWTGIRESFQEERNVRIHGVAILAVVILGLWLGIDAVRWAILALACGAVLATELLNTALERLTDMVTSELCEEARQVKDMAAGAVFVAAIFAALAGLAVFAGPLLRKMGLI